MRSGSTPNLPDYYSDLKTPDSRDMEIQLEELVQQGVLTPEEAQTITLGDSEMKGITLDPKLKQAQMAALASLENISDQGGMNLTDRSNLNQIAAEENTRARGQREAILQNAQARGLGGSGLELMSQMQNQQDAATRTSQRDMDISAMAQQRALEAIMGQGQMAGQIGAQDFNQQAQVAGAQDAISKFNAQNAQGQINQNIQARNQAQAANLGAKQSIAEYNNGLRNQQQQYNKGLQQQKFQNEMAKRGGQSGIAVANDKSQADQATARANADNQSMSTALSFAGLYAPKNTDEDKKEKY